MKGKRLDQDTYIGLFLIIFSAIGLILSLNLPKGSDLFPKILFSILGLLAIPILVKSIKRNKVTFTIIFNNCCLCNSYKNSWFLCCNNIIYTIIHVVLWKQEH